VIPGRPMSLKNGKRIFINKASGKRFPASTNKYKTWAMIVYYKMLQAKKGPLIKEPINVSMKFYFKNHAHEMDLSNCYQAFEDILQKACVIENDKQIYGHDNSRKIFNDPNERVEIEITSL